MQTFVPLIPLKLEHVAVIPEYAEQAAEISTQPAPVVTQPARAPAHAKSVVRDASCSVQILFVHVTPHVQALG